MGYGNKADNALFHGRGQRSSCCFPVRADARAASRISMTCTFSFMESGSSIGLLFRMQSTKYEIGLLVAFGAGSSAIRSPSNPTLEALSAGERKNKSFRVASRLPFGQIGRASCRERV